MEKRILKNGASQEAFWMAQTELRKKRKVFAQVDNLNLQSVPSVHLFTCHCCAPVICSNFCFHSWSYIPVCYIYLLVHTVNLVSPSWTVSPTQAESSSVLTEINTTVIFKQRHGSFLVFLRPMAWEQLISAPIKVLSGPFVWRHLEYFLYSTGCMQKRGYIYQYIQQRGMATG